MTVAYYNKDFIISFVKQKLHCVKPKAKVEKGKMTGNNNHINYLSRKTESTKMLPYLQLQQI